MKNIKIGFKYSYTVGQHCVLNVFPKLLPKKIKRILLGWDLKVQTHGDLCDSRAVSYQLDHRDWQLEAARIIYFSSGYRNKLKNVKFASGIKNVNFGFYPYTDECLHCIFGAFPSSLLQWRSANRKHFDSRVRALPGGDKHNKRDSRGPLPEQTGPKRVLSGDKRAKL